MNLRFRQGSAEFTIQRPVNRLRRNELGPADLLEGDIGAVDVAGQEAGRDLLDVDDIGMIHVLFENGSQLGLLVGMDKFHIETEAVFVKPEWKRSCYCLDSMDFHALLKGIYPDVKAIVVHYDMDGLWVSSDADDEWGPADKELCEKIGQYLGVRVTSIHIDDCDEPGIWIVYTK